MTDIEVTAGEARFREVLKIVGNPDPRDDIDTASLVRRFPRLADVDVEQLEFEGPHGAIPARAYRGPSEPQAGLVWVHGGAFVAGSLDMPESHWFGLELASRGISVLAIDYRKALNGVHHPVPSDDVLAGWLVAANEPWLWGPATDRLFLGGASAGANLATGVTVRLRAGEGPMPRGLVLVYPVLHAVVPPPSREAARAVRALHADARFDDDFMLAINKNYLGSGGDFADQVAFPANADAEGMPPALIINAEADDLRPSGEAYGAQLVDAGVDVSTLFEPGTSHGYLDLPGNPGALRSIERIVGWLGSRSAR